MFLAKSGESWRFNRSSPVAGGCPLPLRLAALAALAAALGGPTAGRGAAVDPSRGGLAAATHRGQGDAGWGWG